MNIIKAKQEFIAVNEIDKDIKKIQLTLFDR